jgi:hypothetical protein
MPVEQGAVLGPKGHALCNRECYERRKERDPSLLGRKAAKESDRRANLSKAVRDERNATRRRQWANLPQEIREG